MKVPVMLVQSVTSRYTKVLRGSEEAVCTGRSQNAVPQVNCARKLGIVVADARGQHTDCQAKGLSTKYRKLQESRRKAFQLQRMLDDYRQS